MNPNSHSLAMRDPARAALLGAISGSDFGGDFGGDFGDEYGADMFGEFGADAPAAAPVSPAHPAHPLHPANQAKVLALWNQHQAMAKKRSSRIAMMDPNRGSDIKVEGYSFTISIGLKAAGGAGLGTAFGPLTATGFPQVNVKPIRVEINVPTVGFATVAEIKVSNVSITVGQTEDAWKYNSNKVGSHIRVPMLTPSTPATSILGYTGFLPAGGFVGGADYLFATSFEGPANMAGGNAGL